MALAPEPYLSACLAVLQYATVEARSLGWTGAERSLTPDDAKRLAALMDAVHNLPHLLQNWERVNESKLRDGLRAYDEKWGNASHFRLLGTYEQELARRSGAN